MAKIIISRDAQVLQEVQLTRERMTIGRHPQNDIVIEHRTVSGQHAAITTILNDAFLEDLHSTNGTFVNGQRIVKHVLEDRDQITLAKFQIEFFAGPREAAPAAAPAVPPAAVAAPAAVRAAPAAAADTPMAPPAMVEVTNGPNAGKQLALSKPLTTLGKPGVLVVVISRAQNGYAITHIDGERSPMVNEIPLGKAGRLLAHRDVIDLAGTQMTFLQP